jgi:type IV pilus assembly protein PilA
MIARINSAIAKKREEGEKGFTLIELLVVILIIGVLAAIAIPVFLNQRQGAWEAQVQSDIANAVIAIESYSVGNNGDYTGATETILEASYGFNPTPDVTLVVVDPDNQGYGFSVTHLQYTDWVWTYSSSDGVTVRTAAP